MHAIARRLRTVAFRLRSTRGAEAPARQCRWVAPANLIAVASLLLVPLACGIESALALTPGGGSKTTDCLAEFGGTAANSPSSRPRDIRCTDNDPICDLDPLPGVCQFDIEICLNVTDPNLPTCAPQALESFIIENEQPDTNPKHDFDFQTLEDQLNSLVLPLAATDLDVCSGAVQMSVRLPIQPSKIGGRFRRGRKSIASTSVTPPKC